MTYIELHAKSAFSFLEAAALPETLAERAAALGQRALALVDTDGVYGAPRFYRACTRLGLTPLVGAEISMRDGGRLPLLVEDREGYRNLCRLLTRIKMRAPKGQGAAGWEDLEEYAGGLVCLTGGVHGLVAHRLIHDGDEAARGTLDRLAGLFGRFNVYAELQRDLSRDLEAQNEWLRAEAEHLGLPLLASNAPLMAERGERPLLDTLTCIRHGTTLAQAGRLLARNSERFLKPASEMERLFADCPAAVANTGELALRLAFTMKDIGYRFPDYPLPPGQTPIGFLRVLCERGAKTRYGAGPLAEPGGDPRVDLARSPFRMKTAHPLACQALACREHVESESEPRRGARIRGHRRKSSTGSRRGSGAHGRMRNRIGRWPETATEAGANRNEARDRDDGPVRAATGGRLSC